MSEQKGKLFMAAFSALLAVSLLIAASYSIFPSQEGINPLPSPTASPTPLPTVGPSTVAPAPTASPSTSSYSPLPLLVDLTPDPPVTASPGRAYIVGRGESISLEVNVISYSEAKYTTPLYLAIGGFENQGSGYIVIATPPAPYSSQLPWPSKYVQQSNDTLPLTAEFDINPLTIEPMGKAVSRMTLEAAENATVGSYHILINLGGNLQHPQRGDTGFEVRVEP